MNRGLIHYADTRPRQTQKRFIRHRDIGYKVKMRMLLRGVRTHEHSI